jgi:hypothetical protein
VVMWCTESREPPRLLAGWAYCLLADIL